MLADFMRSPLSDECGTNPGGSLGRAGQSFQTGSLRRIVRILGTT